MVHTTCARCQSSKAHQHCGHDSKPLFCSIYSNNKWHSFIIETHHFILLPSTVVLSTCWTNLKTWSKFEGNNHHQKHQQRKLQKSKGKRMSKDLVYILIVCIYTEIGPAPVSHTQNFKLLTHLTFTRFRYTTKFTGSNDSSHRTLNF